VETWSQSSPNARNRRRRGVEGRVPAGYKRKASETLMKRATEDAGTLTCEAQGAAGSFEH